MHQIAVAANSPPVRRSGRCTGRRSDLHSRRSVLDEILDYSEQDLSAKWAGFLIGGCHQDRRDVRGDPPLPARDRRPKPAGVADLHARNVVGDDAAGGAAVSRRAGRRLASHASRLGRLPVRLRPVHPPPFLLPPWQVAMVVDPCRSEFGFFQWRGERIVDCGFVCVFKDG